MRLSSAVNFVPTGDPDGSSPYLGTAPQLGRPVDCSTLAASPSLKGFHPNALGDPKSRWIWNSYREQIE